MEIQRKKDGSTGVAWLLSARAVGCPLKCGNERNPCPVLNTSRETAPAFAGEEGEDDFKSA